MNSHAADKLQPSIAGPERLIKTVRLKLSKEGKKTFGTNLSSDGYASFINNILMPLDLLFTYFLRYPRVLDYDIPNSETAGSSHDNGFPIETTVHHHAIGVAVWVVFAGISAYSGKAEANRQIKNKNNHSAKYIYDMLKENFEDFEPEVSEDKEQKVALSNTPFLDTYIQESFTADTNLRKKYKSIEFIRNLSSETEELKIEVYVDNENPDPVPELNLTNPTSRLIESGTTAVEDEDEDENEDVDKTEAPQHAQQPQSLIMRKLSLIYNTVNKASHLLINKLLFPIYQTLVIASFVYWIEWIGAGIFTGDFLNFFSIKRIPNFVAFGFPAVVALTYPCLKIYNYMRNRVNRNPDEATVEQENDADKDFHNLIRKALARKEFDLERTALKIAIITENKRRKVPAEDKDPHDTSSYVISSRDGSAATALPVISQFDKKIKSLHSPLYLVIKPVVNFFSYGFGSFVALQYSTWIVAGAARNLASYFISNLDSVSDFITGNFAIPLLCISVVVGLYKAGQAFLEVLDQNKILDDKLAEHNEDFFEQEEKLRLHEAKYGKLIDKKPLVKEQVNHLETQFFEDAKRHGPNEYTRWKKWRGRVIKYIDGCCTGIFIARAFIVKNSAIALPKIMIFSFSSPVTIGILIGAGLLFGAFKAGEYILSRHYAYGQDLLKTRTERLEYLKNEVEIADLREKLFIAKHNANNLALNDVVITPVNVVTDARSYIYSFNFFSSYSGRGHQVLPIEEARTGVGVRVA